MCGGNQERRGKSGSRSRRTLVREERKEEGRVLLKEGRGSGKGEEAEREFQESGK